MHVAIAVGSYICKLGIRNTASAQYVAGDQSDDLSKHVMQVAIKGARPLNGINILHACTKGCG